MTACVTHTGHPQVPGSGAPPTSAAGTSAIPDNQPPDTTTSDCVNSELFQSTSSDSLPPTLVQLSPAPQQAPPTSGDRGECGVAVMELNSVQMFFVSCFRGDPTHDSMCVWVSAVEGLCGWGLTWHVLNGDVIVVGSRLGTLSPWQPHCC